MEREQYLKIYENGIRHINAAELLAEQGHYGFASSHLVLGMEELIKYQVVLSDPARAGVVDIQPHELFEDKEVNPNHRKSVFRDHGTKHDLVKEFQIASSPEFMMKHLDYVFHVATGQELSSEHLETRTNRFKQLGSFLAGAYQEICIPQSEKEAFFNWLGNANALKNKGFYVDSKSGSTETPADISRDEYLISVKYVVAIQKQTEVLKDLDMTDDEFDDYMNSPIDSNSGSQEDI